MDSLGRFHIEVRGHCKGSPVQTVECFMWGMLLCVCHRWLRRDLNRGAGERHKDARPRWVVRGVGGRIPNDSVLTVCSELEEELVEEKIVPNQT